MAIVNFLSWGATFLYRNVASYLDINLLIGYTGQEKVPITGTMTGSVPLLDANRVKITQERFVFLIDTALLSATGLVLQRGLEIQIVSNDAIYEIVLDPKGSNYNNDPNQQRKTIICTKKDPSYC